MKKTCSWVPNWRFCLLNWRLRGSPRLNSVRVTINISMNSRLACTTMCKFSFEGVLALKRAGLIWTFRKSTSLYKINSFCIKCHFVWYSSKDHTCTFRTNRCTQVSRPRNNPQHPQQLPWCPLLLLWCPLQSSNTNWHFPHRASPLPSEENCFLQERHASPV